MSYVFSIGADIPGASKDLLGGKGYGLWRMKKAGIAVPPAYIITTQACRDYMADPAKVMAEVREQVIPEIVAGLTAEFGYMPLVSVRSGAKFSMPGMMDTILNVGLTADNAGVWATRLPGRCVEDSFKRLIEMYGSVVNGIERKKFEHRTSAERLVFFKLETGEDFPDEGGQLLGAIEAVFKSWNNERAVTYRKLNGIPDDLGTAVVVQAMVFGNFNEHSGTGVAFSRNFSTGENKIVGDYLSNGQGEDVVAGIRNTEPLSVLSDKLPFVAAELLVTIAKLESMERDMVDVEFTIQDGKLYILQVRAGKRTSQAALRIALDLFDEKVISLDEALERITLKQFLAATRPVVNVAWAGKNPPHVIGVGASNGAVSGLAVFSSADAVASKVPCILVAEETTPDDIAGMSAAVGILTATGGTTSHAAVVARSMDKVCVVGCTALHRTDSGWFAECDRVSRPIRAGDRITLDGGSGGVWIEAEVPIEGGVGNGYAARFFALLEERYSFYRTVTSVEEMSGAQKLLVATYDLDRFGLDKFEQRVETLFKAIEGREAVIDLRSFGDFVREADAPLEYIFGDRSNEATQLKVNVLCAIAEAKELENAKVLPFGLSKAQIKNLETSGVTFLSSVKTLDDLLAVSGLCVADFDALEAVSRKTIAEVLALKKRAGEVVQSFNIVEEIGADQINRGALFALSPIQAAQSFLKQA